MRSGNFKVESEHKREMAALRGVREGKRARRPSQIEMREGSLILRRCDSVVGTLKMKRRLDIPSSINYTKQEG